MRRFIAAAVIATLGLTSGAALGGSCPVVIKQGRDAVAKLKADDPKAKAATAKLDEAQKLHEAGKHADSLKTANEALTALGVK